ncbi:hypothetical protein ACFFX1_25470 [Dactylosporangium sucinum]|uniref:Lipoprotein n=1 Tax=Dactylosporangium sucinum TaxID=1424081 RepID=A0A917T5G2_9ACTN|nr:hypothetical protein [Dactylosporangium sucinum]GGM11080.1 hypothetical protein GCM10007977_010270 [Dactylosporangium sucinum]
MRPAAAVLSIAALGCLMAGCTRQDDDPIIPPASVAPTSGTTRSPTPPSTPLVPSHRPSSASPSPSGFSEAYVVQCNGRPSGEQVLAAVRRARPELPTGSGMTVKNQPLCAGIWQYTVLTVTNSEPLQVITKGSPSALTVVTAGTDPCTVEVRATAPPALLNVASC